MIRLFCLFLILGSMSQVASAGSSPKVTQELLNQGKKVFLTNCMLCHGEHGRGDGPAAPGLVHHPRNFVADKFTNGDSPDQIFNTLGTGISGTEMPSFASLNETDRWAVAHYIANLRNEKGK